MRHASVGKGALVLLIVMLLAGCGGGTKKGDSNESLSRSAYVRVNLVENATPRAINASGAVVMSFQPTTLGTEYRPTVVVWNQWGVTDIGQPLANPSQAVDINDAGQVLLLAYNYAPLTRTAYLYTNGVYTEIRSPEPNVEVIPRSLAQDGTVIGYLRQRLDPWENQDKPFLWRNGQMTTLEGQDVSSINAQGQFLVKIPTPSDSSNTGWHLRHPDGRMVPLTEMAPGTRLFTPNALSDTGVIVGVFIEETSNRIRPGVIRNGKLEDVVPDAEDGTATGVNSRGDIIGTTKSGPFVVRSTGTVLDLSDLFPEISTWDKDRIQLISVNEEGRILGTVNSQVFVLVPRPLFR